MYAADAVSSVSNGSYAAKTSFSALGGLLASGSVSLLVLTKMGWRLLNDGRLRRRCFWVADSGRSGND